MNELKTLQEDFREYFDKTLKPKKETMKNLDRELCVNALEKAYTLGMMKGVEAVEGVVPREMLIVCVPNDEWKLKAKEYYNKCRSEILSNITKIKQELK